MDNMYETRIANEARRVAQIARRDDADANWREAVENLAIFPDRTFDASSLRQVAGTNSVNAFGVPTFMCSVGYINWHECRETFERDLFNVGATFGNFRWGFVMRSLPGDEFRMPHFIRNIEAERLNLPELTTFMRVSYLGRATVVYVRPSGFWTSCPMRFSLFTILCRAGRKYFFNTIEDALMSYEYSRQTFAAINLFLNHGRRNYTGNPPEWNEKWVYQYGDLHESQITTLVA